MKGIKYAVEWIAYNDDPTVLDADEIEGFISVLLVADLFGKTPDDIARRVVRIRSTIEFGSWVTP